MSTSDKYCVPCKAERLGCGETCPTCNGDNLLQLFTPEEVAKRGTPKDIWLIIHGHVYALAKFQNDHPGGPDVLAAQNGKDCTVEFEDVFHSQKARDDMPKYRVGRMKGYTGEVEIPAPGASGGGGGGVDSKVLLAIAVLVVGIAAYYKFFLQ